MVTIEEAARQLGLTPRQVYRRIAAARRELAPYLRRGRNGALVLDEVALEILRVAEDLRKTSGVTVADAIVEALKEYGTNGDGKRENPGGELAEAGGKQEKAPENKAEKQANTDLWPGLVLWILAASCAVGAAALVAIAIALWR